MCLRPKETLVDSTLPERDAGSANLKYPSMPQIKSWLPKEVFELSTAKSMRYFGRDAALILVTQLAIATIRATPTYQSCALPLQLLSLLPLQFLGGFFMWCMFVVGHDCGHTTFSQFQCVNEFMGEAAHSFFLCTPFDAWRRSHHRHHSFHNHFIEDYSHMWFYKSELDKPGSTTTPITLSAYLHYLGRAITPLVNWPLYLYVGRPDGGHLFLYGRLWKDAKWGELARGYVSSAVTLASMYFWYTALSPSHNFVACYVMPWVWYGWWLFTVTYFQHHFDEMVLFERASTQKNSTFVQSLPQYRTPAFAICPKLYSNLVEQGAWSYVRGAFETIDRTFGLGIDNFHHNITDCHVVHHLLFTKIPHHNLRKATDAMCAGLKANGYPTLYKHEQTRDFFPKIFSFFTEHWFLVEDHKVISKLKEHKAE